jgi:hypothetical protein
MEGQRWKEEGRRRDGGGTEEGRRRDGGGTEEGRRRDEGRWREDGGKREKNWREKNTGKKKWHVPCSSSINRYASAFLPQARKFPSRHLLIFPEPLIRVRYKKEDEQERKGRTNRRGRRMKRVGN